MAGDGGSEAGVPHSRGMTVGDGLDEDGIGSHLTPINLEMNGLERLVQAKAEKREPTSLRFFCFRMANKKRAMALSLLGDMMASWCRI